jgi:hypothetical protein
MQHARHTLDRSDDPPRARRPLSAAGAQDVPVRASPARQLQAALQSAYDSGLDAPAAEPAVVSWPGWAKLAVLSGGAALSWGGVIWMAKLLF